MSSEIRKWEIPLGKEFREIKNKDSIQFTNPDGSRVVYFSILNITDSDSEPTAKSDMPNMSAVVESDQNGFTLKGTKVRDGKVLVIVISYIHTDDSKWAMDLFENIN